jgi:hypothetical protein
VDLLAPRVRISSDDRPCGMVGAARGRFAGRYDLDVWVFYGRRHPTKAQLAAAQRMLSGVRWPAWL